MLSALVMITLTLTLTPTLTLTLTLTLDPNPNPHQVLSAVVMISGFLTFGGAADGYILNNYATTDKLAQLARLAIGGSIVTTYPLLHQGLRDTVQELLAQKGIAASRQSITFAMVLGHHALTLTPTLTPTLTLTRCWASCPTPTPTPQPHPHQVLGIMLVGMKLTDLGVVAAVSGALVSTSLVHVLTLTLTLTLALTLALTLSLSLSLSR